MLSALLFALASNLDNFVIGAAYGMKKIKLGIGENLLIAIISSICTFLVMYLAEHLLINLPIAMVNAIGSLILIGLGGYFTIESTSHLINSRNTNDLALKDIYEMADYAKKSDSDNSGSIDLKESIAVGFALSINNIGAALGAAATNIPIIYAVSFTFILSITAIILGQGLVTGISKRFIGKYSPLISGLLLIILGVFELLY